MKIYWREITDQQEDFDFTQDEKWVAEAVRSVDEVPGPGQRETSVHFDVRKVDDVVVANGNIKTSIRLACSRCAKQFAHPCDFDFSNLFSKDPEMAGVAHFGRPDDGDEGSELKLKGKNKGHARHAASHSLPSDMDITFLAEDFIDLADVLSEQLRLQLPFQPLCQEDCKGMCPQCGADLNVGRCACAKVNPTHPFAALRKLKL